MFLYISDIFFCILVLLCFLVEIDVGSIEIILLIIDKFVIIVKLK